MSRSTTQMALEIAEQPAVVAATLDSLREMREELARLARGRRVVMMARGSSDNAAIYGRYLIEGYAGASASLGAPSIATHYDVSPDLSGVLMVGVSQSGRTEEIIAAQQWARRCGAATVAITNADSSPLAAVSDLALVTRAGAEKAVPATKTYVTQLVAMAQLAAVYCSPEQTAALDDALDRVPGAIEEVLKREPVGLEILAALGTAEHVVVSGRGMTLSTALELALKLEETCLRPVRGYSYADLRHGPIAAVDHGEVAVLISSNDGPMLGAMRDLAADLDRRGARTVGIGGDQAFVDACDMTITGVDLPDIVAPIGLIVPGQLVVEQLALAIGLNPDEPRGLSKVTRSEPQSGEQSQKEKA